jgi:hypothetical protein
MVQLTGGIGRKSLTTFYRDNFIFQNSDDTELELISRTIGIDRVVDEFLYKFTHNKTIDWLYVASPSFSTTSTNVPDFPAFHQPTRRWKSPLLQS